MSIWFVEVLESGTHNRIQTSNGYTSEEDAIKIYSVYSKQYENHLPEVYIRKTWLWVDGIEIPEKEEINLP